MSQLPARPGQHSPTRAFNRQSWRMTWVWALVSLLVALIVCLAFYAFASWNGHAGPVPGSDVRPAAGVPGR